jgi:hypothetical protein
LHNNEIVEYIDAAHGNNEEITIELNNIEKGIYLVYFEADWESPE